MSPLQNSLSFKKKKKEAGKWCLGNCLQHRNCFGEATFEIENIRRCKRIPEIYRFYWEARHSNIKGIFPLVICHSEEKNDAE